MSKNIHPIEQEELMAYLDGELETERAAIAASHLEQCKECQRLADDLQDVSQKLMVWQVASVETEITPEVAVALDECVSGKDKTVKPDARNSRWKDWREAISLRRLMVPGLAAVVLILVISMGLSTMRTGRKSLSPFIPERKIAQSRESGRYGAEPVVTKTEPGAESGLSRTGSVDFYYDSGNNLQSTQIQNGPLPAPQPTPPQPKKDQRRDSAIPAGPMIVRTVDLALVATEFDQARKSLEDTVKRHHGYFGNLATGGAADAGRTLDAILRVPADQLDGALAELKKLGRVESESQKGDEVSQQYVDLQARLVNARNTEQRLTDLLRERTGRLSDVLEVEQQIDSVRERIEQMDAERKNLANQVAFATVTMKMREDYKARVQMVPPSTSSRIRNAAVDGYETMVAGLINIALFLVSWGPSLLLWSMILFFPVRILWRRVRRSRAA
jgi:hypothetical protein